MTDFATFFESLWKDETWPKPEPFPWQSMLAERGTRGDWPEAINLPTASGKTACLDVAVYALAATANTRPENRMPRRIWFVVDRRIVVDEAHERARKIAGKLAKADEGPAKEIADQLRKLSGTNRPLAVARLRGGAWRDDGWARIPSQPAIICSTVDQVGSALLFRAYGHGDRTASIYAGLAAQDSLILLDEAHCAVPFLQTLRAVARFRGEPWADQPLNTPFRSSIMSATPPAGVSEEASFPKPDERYAALDHPFLQKRFRARKLATLEGKAKGDEQFITKAAGLARGFAIDQDKRRVAVMVNRVATAEQIAEYLRKELGDRASVVLLTGRMRPLDRDELVKRWESKLKAGSHEALSEPVIVVTTQCLEVGADFSFDALVTGCASLDALRQRFGRLDRLGELGESRAAILIHEKDTKEPKDEKDADPIYGRAIYETWKWLNQRDLREADGTVNFGIEAMNARAEALRAVDKERFGRLLAPASDAPILLPAHLDLLCQTSPCPLPEPDVALFLHGKDRGAPEVRVVVRAALPELAEAWVDLLSLVPPTSPEMLIVPLYRLRDWLTKAEANDVSGDVEGAVAPTDEGSELAARQSQVPFLLWRGPERSELTRDLRRIRPNDVVVLRADGRGLRGLGQAIEDAGGVGPGRLDLAERALRQSRGRVVLRIQNQLLGPWLERPAVKNLVNLATQPESEREDLTTALRAILEEDDAVSHAESDGAVAIALPDWMKGAIETFLEDGFRMDDHPAGGCILTGKKRRAPEDAEEDDPLADEDDLTSKSWGEVTLRQHTADVYKEASELASRCLDPEFRSAFVAAADCHDLGKFDWRFQVLLRNGAEDEVEAGPALAKSAWLPERRRRRSEIQEVARLPQRFRHEFLSMQIAEHFRLVPGERDTHDLALHLISSHHGYGRPFAPVVPDPSVEQAALPDISLACLDSNMTLTAGERQTLTPACRLDSGVSERFWRLTHRYGWWGLAYLEAIFRLADWEASRHTGSGGQGHTLALSSSRACVTPAANRTALDALDGANPLAFLAALGALRLLTHAFPENEPRLSWHQRLGAWRPLLHSARPLSEEALLTALRADSLSLDAMFSTELLAASEAASPKNKKGEPRWKDKLFFPVAALRKFCEAAAISPSPLAEYSAAWAGETAQTDEGCALRTRFDFTAGQQAFVGMLRELLEKCTSEDLRHSLFTGWNYSANAVSMRWDTEDEKRQYALQAVDPTDTSGNPPLADLGANFLAVQGLPLFPLVADRGASQPGFSSSDDGRRWRWPIWSVPLDLDTVRALLMLPLAELRQWSLENRHALGVEVVLESRIVQPSGRYRCFTPAQSL